MSNSNDPAASGLKARFWKEMRRYAEVSIYLYVCFAALLLYKSSILSTHEIQFAPQGMALVKALVLGKFIVVGEAIKLGTRRAAHSVLHRIALKSLALLLLLVVLTFLEELIVGLFHDETLRQALSTYFAKSWLEHVAPGTIMFLVLMPLVGFAELREVLGPGVLKKLLLSKESEVSRSD